MQKFEREYAVLIGNVLYDGEKRRTRNATTLSVFGKSLSFDLRGGFPLLVGRKIFYNGVLGELAGD